MKRKTIQIAALPAGSGFGTVDRLIALCEDGSIWLGGIGNRPMKWEQIDGPPDAPPGQVSSFDVNI